jgi:hypothetical protein
MLKHQLRSWSCRSQSRSQCRILSRLRLHPNDATSCGSGSARLCKALFVRQLLLSYTIIWVDSPGGKTRGFKFQSRANYLHGKIQGQGLIIRVCLRNSVGMKCACFYLNSLYAAGSVGDPDPVGSGPFCRIQIRKFFTGSGSRSRIRD